MLIFVYGTLKRGQPRNHLLAGQEFLCEAETARDYRLFRVADYPGMVQVAPGNGVQVLGEIWRVDQETLARLDEYEGVDEGLYERKPVKLNTEPLTIELTDPVDCWFYLPDIEGCTDCGDHW